MGKLRLKCFHINQNRMLLIHDWSACCISVSLVLLCLWWIFQSFSFPLSVLVCFLTVSCCSFSLFLFFYFPFFFSSLIFVVFCLLPPFFLLTAVSTAPRDKQVCWEQCLLLWGDPVGFLVQSHDFAVTCLSLSNPALLFSTLCGLNALEYSHIYLTSSTDFGILGCNKYNVTIVPPLLKL